jgi:hypothetical protein
MLDLLIILKQIIYWPKYNTVSLPILKLEQAAFSLVDSILSAINNKLMLGGTFCNLQNAFDCVTKY